MKKAISQETKDEMMRYGYCKMPDECNCANCPLSNDDDTDCHGYNLRTGQL